MPACLRFLLLGALLGLAPLPAAESPPAAATPKARKPTDIAFTAVDGRPVSLTQLRGKVVLIDFWATWSAPTVVELTNQKKVYAKYHDLGFEIIGITFENARIDPKDWPAAVTEKKKAARERLVAFLKDNQIPWPQYFDGEHWNNAFGRRFDIKSLPASMLLDREGRVISTQARGEALEPLVRKLLGR